MEDEHTGACAGGGEGEKAVGLGVGHWIGEPFCGLGLGVVTLSPIIAEKKTGRRAPSLCGVGVDSCLTPPSAPLARLFNAFANQ